jgi:hypothetical protein
MGTILWGLGIGPNPQILLAKNSAINTAIEISPIKI